MQFSALAVAVRVEVGWPETLPSLHSTVFQAESPMQRFDG